MLHHGGIAFFLQLNGWRHPLTADSGPSNLSVSLADRSSVDTAAWTPSNGEANPSVSPHTRFVARQPILSKEEKVFGYALLFRARVEDYFRAADPDAASRNTLDSSVLLGLDVLCGGQRAFINCTREVLLNDCMTLLPPNRAVAEILESLVAEVYGQAMQRARQVNGE